MLVKSCVKVEKSIFFMYFLSWFEVFGTKADQKSIYLIVVINR